MKKKNEKEKKTKMEKMEILLKKEKEVSHYKVANPLLGPLNLCWPIDPEDNNHSNECNHHQLHGKAQPHAKQTHIGFKGQGCADRKAKEHIAKEVD